MLLHPRSGSALGWRRGIVLSTGLVAMAVMTPQAKAVSIPYSNNFDDAALGTTLPADFTEAVGAAGTTADYSIGTFGTGRALNATLSASTNSSGSGVGANASAAVRAVGFAGSDFSITSDFTLNSFSAPATASAVNFGLGAAGSAANFSTGTQYRLLYNVFGATAGRLTLIEGTNTLATAPGSIAPSQGLAGSLSLSGTYVGGSLILSGTMSTSNGTLSVNFTDITPQAGEFFGYRTALSAQLGGTQTGPLVVSQDVTYDNFNVSVPEPTSIGLLSLGAVGLLARRRRAQV